MVNILENGRLRSSYLKKLQKLPAQITFKDLGQRAEQLFYRKPSTIRNTTYHTVMHATGTTIDW